MGQIIVGDKVTLRHKLGAWGVVENLNNSTVPSLTSFDVRYDDDEVETGMTLANIEEHQPQ
ncbi:hypothetical protein J7T14_13450 [Citrobacter freundii]|uniref:hypothetical protein n=1 Tax=Citrobacter freundii complex TaxID=1344959 RepID=UPI001B3770DE|nr:MULTISPECIES: hypothetical protein [Citrobacter freundii complex]MBQ0346432.1 hypothetical protein [Citrobacter freundii]URR14410.1 hypothetical protein LT980_07445 [Citrobacter portucalensis]